MANPTQLVRIRWNSDKDKDDRRRDLRWSSKAECSSPGKTEEVRRTVFPGRELACVSPKDRGQDGMCDEASAHCSCSTEFGVRRGRAVWREPKCRERWGQITEGCESQANGTKVGSYRV